tara:strand:+ start:129 stop:476 length:348 start_codon:yes stop_codon:yes gene_type:complete
MNLKYIALSALLFTVGQLIVWIQVNGPIIWTWAKEWRWALMFCGVPITYLFMEATKYAVDGFQGEFWPGRFLSFVSGIFMFTLMTYLVVGESITLKTAICLLLSLSIILIQLFWK